MIGLVSLLGITSCGSHSNYFRKGKFNDAPYTELNCFEKGNDYGFSFEIPWQFCGSGIKLQYLAKRIQTGGVEIKYIKESGVFTDSLDDDIRVVANTPNRIDAIYVGGRKLPSYDNSDFRDKSIWDMQREVFATMWENYGPVVRDMYRTCAKEKKTKLGTVY